MWDFGEGNRGPEMAVVAIVVTSLTVIAVSLRCYTMIAILKRFMVEDWLAVITCLFQVAFCTFVLLGVSHGLGAHVANVPEEERPKALVWKWAGQVAYIVVSTLVKFVVGIFLLRLCVNNGWQRITIWILLVLVGLFNAFYVFVAVFQCQPVAFYWWRYTTDPPVTGKCNGHALATIPTYIAVLLGIAGDLILALLPITLIKKAKLDKKTKISVVCVLSLGSLASVATIARIPYAQQLLSNPDYLYNFTDLAIWSIVECGIAITASSLATLRPLFVKLRILASNHFSSHFTSIKAGSVVLPMFSNNNTTVLISASHRHDTQDNRYTAMPVATAASGEPGVSARREKTEGIQVEKEFEMSIITREGSQDSIDQLEAEVNEVIRPGTARLSASRDRQTYGSIRSSPRSSLSPIQTSLWDAPMIAPSSTMMASAASPMSFSGGAWPLDPTSQPKAATQSPRSLRSARKTNFRQSQRRQSHHSTGTTFGGIGSALTDDAIRSTPQPPWFRHQSTSSDSILTDSGTQLSPAPSFHLPIGRQRQSTASTASGASRASNSAPGHSRGTFGGAGGSHPPVRMKQPSHGEYMRGINTELSNPPTGQGNHTDNESLHNTPITPTSGSPATMLRFPFQKQETIREAKEAKRRMRVSGFRADAGDDSDQELTGPQPLYPDQEEPASPLRSHPRTSPNGNWV